MDLYTFFNNAEANNWRMSWSAWRVLVIGTCELGVLDDDSGCDADTNLHAREARRAFFACTVGPARLFKAA